MPDYDIPPQAVAAAAYGLLWEAERQGLNLHGYDIDTIAHNALLHALASSYIVTHVWRDRQVARAAEPAERWKRSWAAECHERDRLAAYMQLTLAKLAEHDPEAAAALAKDASIIIPPPPS